MQPLSLIRAFLEQASAQGSRSTVLRPLGWMLSICFAATIAAIGVKAPSWLVILFAVFVSLCAILYLGTYLYCLLTDKEALRSETYSIQRLAIEKGFVGDSSAGIFKIENPGEPRLIAGSASRANEEQQ
jgi:hypothetical protein